MQGEITTSEHIPVLKEAVLSGLNARPGAVVIDGTLGGGGHAEAILRASTPGGRLLGLDCDAEAIEQARARLDQNELGTCSYYAVHASYAEMGVVAPHFGFEAVDGILLDLGYSSLQIDNAARGFSFRRDGPLDMRFDRRQRKTAADLVNGLPEDELARVIREYGEERYARRIARAIVSARPIESTVMLAEVIERSKPRRASGTRQQARIHPATRTFQALRMAVNDELGALERVLPQTVELLRPGGRLVVISFHSLEDRVVKQFMRREASDCVCPPEQPVCTCERQATLEIMTRKPIVATEEEIRQNPRARSAKLRVAERR